MPAFYYRKIQGFFPHVFYQNRDDEIRPDALWWCSDEFGECHRGERWTYSTEGDFAFRDENDAFAFRMRWC